MEETCQPDKTAASLDELRARIAAGRYEVDPQRVAEAMLAAVLAPRGIRPRDLK